MSYSPLNNSYSTPLYNSPRSLDSIAGHMWRKAEMYFGSDLGVPGLELRVS